MASSGRRVSELTREELESLVIEIHAKLDASKKTVHEQQELVKRLQTRVKLSESSLQSVTLNSLQPPKPLRPGASVKNLKRNTNSHTRGMPVAGAFNPYHAGNCRLTTLHLYMSDLRRQVSDMHASLKSLARERAEINAKLERGTPTRPLFRREFLIPKHCDTTPRADASHCMEALEHLIKLERTDSERDVLVCCHNLLTGRDRPALDLFQLLLDPTSGPSDVLRLQKCLLDQDAHASILVEKVRSLKERHELDREAYVDLRARLNGHVRDEAELAAKLREQIADSDERIGRIAPAEEEVARLAGALKTAEEALARAKQDAAAASAEDADAQRAAVDLRARMRGLREKRAALKEATRKADDDIAREDEKVEGMRTELGQAEIEARNLEEEVGDHRSQRARLERAGIGSTRALLLVVSAVNAGRTVANLLAEIELEEKRVAAARDAYKAVKGQCRDQLKVRRELKGTLALLMRGG
jgi:DNA repair exonuclease SbcCD ATPase subunit